MTVDNFLKYIRYELNKSTYTVSSYSSDIHQFIEFITNNNSSEFDYKSITHNDVRLWLGHLSKNGYKPRSLRRKAQALRAYFKYLLKHGYINDNPTSDITLAKIDKPLPEFIRESEMEFLLDESNNRETSDFTEIRNNLIIEILYATGIRQAELLTIHDNDIDSNKSEIKITGKRNKQRIVPIATELLDKIKLYKTIRDTTFHLHLNPMPLFINRGKPMNKMALYRVVKNKLSTIIANKKSPHVLRHTFATAMLNNGASINSVKDFLGHASLASTQIYTHISFRELKTNYELAHPRALKKEV